MIVWAADLHLGSNLRQNCLETSLDGFVALEKLAYFMTREGSAYKQLVLAGDIFDTKAVDGLEIEAFRQFVSKLADRDIPVYTIQGNHDKGHKSISEAMGAINLHKKLVKIDNAMVYGLDFCGIDELRCAMEEVPACDVLVLHQAFEHLLGFDGRFHLRLEDVPARVKNVVVGDIHKSVVANLPNSKGYCISPGSLHPTKIDEDTPHGVYLWSPMGKPVFHQIPGRKIYRVNLEREKDLPELKKKLVSKEEPIPVVELQHTAERTAIADKVREEFEENALFFDKLLVPKTEEEVLAEKELNKRMSLSEALPFVVDPDKDSQVFHVIHELLTTAEPTKTLEMLVEELSA